MSHSFRHDWQREEIHAFYEKPFIDLLLEAQQIHRQYHQANEIQACQLKSIKTGNCPEDCGYCSQSGHHETNIKKEKFLPLEEVINDAKQAKARGATRYCMGAAWRSPPKKDFPQVLKMIEAVKAEGLETCVTLGMLNDEQTQQLKQVGLDFYNHNIDTSPEYYSQITTTRTYQDRLETLEHLRKNQIKICCGGIIGMGESREDRVGLLQQLANLPEHPGSVPINLLMRVEGTPLSNCDGIDNFEFIRTIAAARIMMPKSMVRLSAGRANMNDEAQALCFLAGANSFWLGDILLTTPNPNQNHDQQLLSRLGIKIQKKS